jgi:hypothetical protein
MAMLALARLWRAYAPGGRGRVALRVGCLLFAPFITLFVWMVQGMIWIMMSAPILAYALLMAAVGGGFHEITDSPSRSVGSLRIRLRHRHRRHDTQEGAGVAQRRDLRQHPCAPRRRW